MPVSELEREAEIVKRAVAHERRETPAYNIATEAAE
jgi:hypothetical protein